MPYVPTSWVSGSTPTDAAEMNNIETGVSGAYTELESITANDGTALPSSNGPFTLANFINYLTTLVKSIVGGAHWYSAVPTSLTSLSAGKADLAGATFTGAVQATNVTATGGIIASASNAELEMGAKASANTPFIDFNSSGNSNDYDVRMIASGGTASSGNGTLNIAAASLTRNGNAVMDKGNDGPGSGFDADTVDGVQAAAFALLAGATFTGTVNVSSGSLQQGGKNALFAQAGLTGKFSAQSTAPTSPSDGDLWLDTSTVLS